MFTWDSPIASLSALSAAWRIVSPLLWGVCGNVHATLLLPLPAAAVLPGAVSWDRALC